MIEAKLKFFDIKRCGYYFRGAKNSEFGSLEDSLDKLADWALDGRDVINTTTYQPDLDIDQRNTYFSDWHKANLSKDSVLILWNEAANDNGVIYGIRPSQRPGSNSMLTTGFGNTPAIPGMPSYFWFIPEYNMFASIRFGHSVQGKVNLDAYINGFLENKSPYRVITGEEIVGYSLSGHETDNSSRMFPNFHSMGRKQNELEAELLANRERITRIIKRETLDYTVADQRELLEKIFSGLLNNSPSFTQQRAVVHELQFSPSEAELRQIIKNYAELETPCSIRNVGFIYKDGKRVMLNGTSAAFSVMLDVSFGENEIIRPEILLSELTRQRSDLLNTLFESKALIYEETIS